MVFVTTNDYAIYFGVLNCQCSHFEDFQLNQQNIVGEIFIPKHFSLFLLSILRLLH